MYALLTGQEPPPLLDVLKILATLPWLTTVVPKLSPEIDAVVMRALNPLHEDRYPDAQAMRDALAAARELRLERLQTSDEIGRREEALWQNEVAVQLRHLALD
jgi:hypothetical protein